MKISESIKQYSRFATLACATFTLAVAAQDAFALDGLEVTGINTDHATNSDGEFAMRMARAELCAPGAGGLIMQALSGLQSRIDPRLGGMAAAAGMDSGSSDEMAAAMSDAQRQYQEAMQGLTPEQKAMMEKMGMGNLQQMMGGAAPAAAPAAAGRSPAASSQTAPSGGAEPYYSDNVPQMVQRQLKALGYDPGNTDGTESMQTSIAISQFQAENNMKVTGKASPQLAGVLSARLSNN